MGLIQKGDKFKMVLDIGHIKKRNMNNLTTNWI